MDADDEPTAMEGIGLLILIASTWLSYQLLSAPDKAHFIRSTITVPAKFLSIIDRNFCPKELAFRLFVGLLLAMIIMDFWAGVCHLCTALGMAFCSQFGVKRVRHSNSNGGEAPVHGALHWLGMYSSLPPFMGLVAVCTVLGVIRSATHENCSVYSLHSQAFRTVMAVGVVAATIRLGEYFFIWVFFNSRIIGRLTAATNRDEDISAHEGLELLNGCSQFVIVSYIHFFMIFMPLQALQEAAFPPSTTAAPKYALCFSLISTASAFACQYGKHVKLPFVNAIIAGCKLEPEFLAWHELCFVFMLILEWLLGADPKYVNTCCLMAGYSCGNLVECIASCWLSEHKHPSNPGTVAPFFAVLPTDVQLLVLQTWLGNQDARMQLALSALDVACCNHAVRDQFLFLASHRSNVWDNRDQHLVSKDVLNYMRWLLSRQVKVKVLYLSDNNMLGLREHCCSEEEEEQDDEQLEVLSVEELVLWDHVTNNSSEVKAVLAMCPNVSSLKGASNDGFNALPPGVWELIPAMRTVKLRKLSVIPHVVASLNMTTDIGNQSDFLDANRLLELCEAANPQIEVLEIPVDAITDMVLSILASNFQQLRILRLGTMKWPSALLPSSVIELVASCHWLEELQLKIVPAAFSVAEVLQACQHHPSLRMFGVHLEMECHYELFTSMLEKHPWLDYLQIGGCHYRRSARALRVTCGGEDNFRSLLVALPRMIEACLPTRSLQLCIQSSDMPSVPEMDVYTMIGQQHGTTMTELTFGMNVGHLTKPFCSFPQLTNLLAHCPALKRIKLLLVRMNDQHLPQLLQHCPQLEYLHVAELFSWEAAQKQPKPELITDAGMEALFAAGCPALKDIHLDYLPRITSKTIQAMAQHNVKLRSLTLRDETGLLLEGDSFGDCSVRALVKQQHHLPVVQLRNRDMRYPMLAYGCAGGLVSALATGAFIVHRAKWDDSTVLRSNFTGCVHV